MFTGRGSELSLLRRHLDDQRRAQLIILYGRRRIGKSTLMAKAVEGEARVLFFEGIEGARTPVQIDQFLTDLSRQTGRIRLGARNWREVFQGLGELVERGRWVLVFDEFPWMGAGRTRIVSELKLYWDRWAKNPNLCLFLCGSLASFMTRHVLHSNAFHNRKTLELCLGPLSPRDAGQFIPKRSARERAQLYMCLGGVPKYLEQVNPSQSLEKNLNRQCFTAGGFFLNEFETLFKEQFRSLKVYESIVEALASAPASLSELARQVGTPKGGGFADQLGNLIRAQFVREYAPVTVDGKRRKRTRLYKLTDPFLRFYFHYIHRNQALIARNRKGQNLFRAIAGSTLQQYYGYAFERLSEDAMQDILDHLELELVDIEEMGTFFQQPRGAHLGLQIDWLIKRRDGVWSLLEMKYTTSPIGKPVIQDIERKIERLAPPESISIEPVLISATGATAAVHRAGYFQSIITLQDLV